MALRDRPMNREEMEEVLEYLRDTIHLPSQQPELILPEAMFVDPGLEMIETVFFDEARSRPESPPTAIHTVPSPREMFENSGAQRYTTFDEAKHRVHYALKELGEPYLVGLEWEPQATLLNHPNRGVHVVLSSTFPWHAHDKNDRGNIVSINLPRSMMNFVDPRNGALEVRSQSVEPQSLHFAINEANTRLENLCKLIAEIYGPCALFLPANDVDVSICTKHYQASWIISNDKDTDRLYTVFNAGACYGRYYRKDGRRHQMRVHINVPYEFTRYSEIEYAWFQAMSDVDYTLPPRLLCYSYTGEDVVSVSKLT